MPFALTDPNGLIHKAEVHLLICDGSIKEAIECIQHNPRTQDLLDTRRQLHMLLLLQQFIELLRQERIQEAVALSRSKLVQFTDMVDANDDDDDEGRNSYPRVEDVVGMLAYEHPHDIDELKRFLSQEQREFVASETLRHIKRHIGMPQESKMVYILQHLCNTYKCSRSNAFLESFTGLGRDKVTEGTAGNLRLPPRAPSPSSSGLGSTNRLAELIQRRRVTNIFFQV